MSSITNQPDGIAAELTKPIVHNTNSILRPPEAAVYLGLTTSTLAKRRRRGELPIFVRLGARAVGYRRVDLDTWLVSCRRRSTSDQGNAPNVD